MTTTPKQTPYTATTIKEGERHRGVVMRADGSHAEELKPRYHKSVALTEAQGRARSLNAAKQTPGHAPGPWKIRGSTLFDGNDVALYKLLPPMGDTLTIAQDDANRRLIEAAPDLYAKARSLTVMARNPDGTVTLGPVGWAQLQKLLATLEDFSP